jgi:CMP-N,N'-diacetyllegionaminic acid synthase
MNIFAIIPARGGSKGVPRKNVLDFDGIPLIAHSILQAKAVNEIVEVYVSTDNDEIADISAKFGAKVIQRPENISGDTATTETAVSHAISEWDSQKLCPDAILLLQATSPLRPDWGIAKAIQTFKEGHYDSLLSLSQTHRFFWSIDGDEARAEYDYVNRPRRQDMTEKDIRYVENGSLYLFTRDHFLTHQNRLGGRIGSVVFPEEYAMEIDSKTDFEILEHLSKNLKKRTNIK